MIISVVYLVVRCLLGCLMLLTQREVSKDAERLVLRYENAVLRRQISQVRYQPGAAPGVRSTVGFTRAFTPRGRRPCCVSQTRSGPEPPGYDRGTRTHGGESRSQMEGFQGEDRHNPLPHIALLTTAPKSVYKNTAFLSTRTTAELRKLLDPGGRE